MSLLTLFLGVWLLTLLAGEHLLANRGIVLGQDMPVAAAWSIRVAYFTGTGGVAILFLWFVADILSAV
ncbi:MAG TPA: hypothetical protein VLD36_15545 [Burkholderiales bacterium]|jgi:hypothetical protein|nr:hypothetical protein [Burkholderiales bacterium]